MTRLTGFLGQIRPSASLQHLPDTPHRASHCVAGKLGQALPFGHDFEVEITRKAKKYQEGLIKPLAMLACYQHGDLGSARIFERTDHWRAILMASGLVPMMHF